MSDVRKKFMETIVMETQHLNLPYECLFESTKSFTDEKLQHMLDLPSEDRVKAFDFYFGSPLMQQLLSLVNSLEEIH